ncbi:hypothetical protein F0562_008319 [Nyssa sinensis]|uniref:DUF604 domain-containing protein n=1 Tax=Nyssa sinensis TaxID=561372 RepID=A0A5J5A8Y9_9ASTE|nr:hypothetical protein F0562_008319 [Nyssa sinensis]
MNFHHLSPKSPTSSRPINLIVISFSVCIIYLLVSLVVVPTSKLVRFSATLQDVPSSPTALEHVVFGIASNKNSWPKRKDYVRLWWRPRQMRGCVFLESMPPNSTISASDSLPKICISDDTTHFRYTYRGGLRSAIRVARVVAETVALNYTNVRWFVFGDDDTVFFPDNLVKTLSKYDHELWHYIGSNSEIYMQNRFFSFDMAFGGAGFAISYPLAKVLAKVFDSCLERYPHLYGSDGRIYSCLAELGIGLTHEPGFHQIDIRGDISGLLACTSNGTLAASFDPHRLLQQTVCYDRWFSWTVSVSWGYAIQVFDNHLFLPDVLRPQETFSPWKQGSALFTFNTMGRHPDRCRRPTVFFLDNVSSGQDGIKSNYRRMIPDNCTIDMASPKKIEEIIVFSKKLVLDSKQLQAPRRHCCDVLSSSVGKLMEISIRECKDDELIYMHP